MQQKPALAVTFAQLQAALMVSWLSHFCICILYLCLTYAIQPGSATFYTRMKMKQTEGLWEDTIMIPVQFSAQKIDWLIDWTFSTSPVHNEWWSKGLAIYDSWSLNNNTNFGFLLLFLYKTVVMLRLLLFPSNELFTWLESKWNKST